MSFHPVICYLLLFRKLLFLPSLMQAYQNQKKLCISKPSLQIFRVPRKFWTQVIKKGTNFNKQVVPVGLDLLVAKSMA